MTVMAIVPIKARVLCKTRLAPLLSDRERVAIARQMLAHVLSVALDTPRIDNVLLLSPERDDVPASICHVMDNENDLNAALQACLESPPVLPADIVVILFADLPFLSSSDITALVDALDDHPLAIAPDRHGTGTNALALRLPSAFQFGFGANSFSRHLQEAQRLASTVAVVRRNGLACDTDSPQDFIACERLSPSLLSKSDRESSCRI